MSVPSPGPAADEQPDDADVPDELLRPVLEFAFVAIQTAVTRGRPAMPAPPALRPLLHFSRLPDRALGTVRRVVVEDQRLREVLAPVVTEEVVGRAGMLWLTRPVGWVEELEAIAEAERNGRDAAADAQGERRASKRLGAAEAAARKSAADLAAARAELASVRAELDGERRLRRGHEEQIARLHASVAARDELVDELRRDLRERDGILRIIEARASDEARRVRELTERALGAETALAELERAIADSPVEADPALPDPRLEVVGEALAVAAASTSALAAALARASAALAPEVDAAVDDPTASVGERIDAPGQPERRREPRPPRRRRAPVALPGGVHATSREAAEVLMKVPDITLMVDGYNVAKTGWPELELAEQRRRLLDALEEAHARHGTRVVVVFDGAGLVTVGGPRRTVRVEFSPPGVTADDVIVERVGGEPIERPVVVASDDGEVRARSRVLGANVVGAAQLLDALRRTG